MRDFCATCQVFVPVYSPERRVVKGKVYHARCVPKTVQEIAQEVVHQTQTVVNGRLIPRVH